MAIRFNVAELIARTGKTRRRELVLSPLFPPVELEADLRAVYLRVVRQWGRVVLERIMPAYAAAIAEGVRDAPADPGGEVEDTGRALNRLVLGLGPDLEDWVVRVEQWHRGKFGQQFTATGVNLTTLLGQGDVATTLQAVLGENTALIRSLDDQLRNGISGAVFRGLTQRDTAATVAKEIRNITSVGRRRAELIAADQLQKLTGRLDQERQEQLGITEFEWAHSRKLRPRPEHVARDGKRYKWTDPVAKNDPPGRAIRCGCRARAVVSLDDAVATEAPAIAPPPPPKPAPAPKVKPGFVSPINPAVTDATVPVQSRLALQKSLRGEFAEAAKHPAYQGPNDAYSGRKITDRGNATFGAAFDDETVSMLAALKPELDNLADQIGIPRLRGFKGQVGKFSANQGDGVMAFNPEYFNNYASNVGGRTGSAKIEAVKAKRAELELKRVPLRAELATLREEMQALEGGMRNPVWLDKYDRLKVVRDEYDKIYKADKKLAHQEWVASRLDARAANLPTWKPGDDVAKRPYGTTEYFDGLDRGRNVLFHEFGHHVHQYLGKDVRLNRRMATPPLEIELGQLFRQANKDLQPSKYATTDKYEWFAENFAAFVMGRQELVDPVLKSLIERIFRREY